MSESPLEVLEKTNTAFDPTTQYLDLTKEEKRRTTALLMAIQAYSHLIIKDAEMYHAIKRDEGPDPGSKIRPATIHAMVEAALEFDDFISGRIQAAIDEVERQEKPVIPVPE